MIIEDTAIINSSMDGKNFKAKKFAYSLRKNIFQEHFALSESECIDPLDDKVFSKIRMQTNVINNLFLGLIVPAGTVSIQYN